MKYLNLLMLLTLSLVLSSCNNNDETDLEIALPISKTYVPSTMEINYNDLGEEQKRNLIHLVYNEHIVNDASDLPDDPMGFSAAYQQIDFNTYTLLIKYELHDYIIDTYSNRYYRNTKENSYNWMVNVGTASDMDTDSDDSRFTRFAILVRKIPADAQVRTWLGLTFLGNNLKTSD